MTIKKVETANQKFFSFQEGLEPKVGDPCPDCGEPMVAVKESDLSNDEFVEREDKVRNAIMEITDTEPHGGIVMSAFEDALAIYFYYWVQSNNLDIVEARKKLNESIDYTLDMLKEGTYFLPKE